MKNQPPIIFAFWPGLPGLIYHGRWSFLTIALGFGGIASGIVFCSGFWSDLISTDSKFCLWGGLAVVWGLLSLTAGRLSLYYNRQLAFDAGGDHFLEALSAYMAGDWKRAESGIQALLKRNNKDPEAILLLATLYRHLGRRLEARETLTRLERLETSEKWAYEIGLERAALKREEENEAEENKNADKNADENANENEAESQTEDEAKKQVGAKENGWAEEFPLKKPTESAREDEEEKGESDGYFSDENDFLPFSHRA